MGVRGEAPRRPDGRSCDGDLSVGADPDDLALAVLAARQGGLLLAQVQRDPRPLAVALDAMIDRIQALTEAA